MLTLFFVALLIKMGLMGLLSCYIHADKCACWQRDGKTSPNLLFGQKKQCCLPHWPIWPRLWRASNIMDNKKKQKKGNLDQKASGIRMENFFLSPPLPEAADLSRNQNMAYNICNKRHRTGVMFSWWRMVLSKTLSLYSVSKPWN